jgi:CelD/BcsL family acetyltransferase involved in cellulose biosynthesis
MVEVRIAENRAELASLAPAWERLRARLERPGPQRSPEWFDAFWKAMETGNARPLAASVWEGAELVALALVRVGYERVGILNTSLVTGLENEHSPSYGWLLAPEPNGVTAIVAALLEGIVGAGRPAPVLRLGNVDFDRADSAQLHSGLEGCGYRLVERVQREPFVMELGDDGAQVIRSLGKRTRKHLRSGANQLARSGAVRFEELSRSPELDRHLAAAWELERDAWQGVSGSAVAQHSSLLEFYEGLAHALAPQGRLGLFALSCNERLVAFAYTMREGDTLYGLKLGFDPAFARVSPIPLLIGEIVHWAAAQPEPLRRFELGGAAEAWKAHFGAAQERIGTLWAFPPSLRGNLVYWTRVGWLQAAERLPGGLRLKRALSLRRGRP